MFTELFFPHNFNVNKVNFDVKFNAYPLLPFWDTDHSKWLTGLRSYIVFRESGPWIKISNVYSRLLFVLYSQRWTAKRFCDTWRRQGPYYDTFNRLSLDGGMPQSFNRGRRKHFRSVCANHNAETEKDKKKSDLKRMSNSKLCCCEIRLKRKKIRKILFVISNKKDETENQNSKTWPMIVQLHLGYFVMLWLVQIWWCEIPAPNTCHFDWHILTANSFIGH